MMMLLLEKHVEVLPLIRECLKQVPYSIQLNSFMDKLLTTRIGNRIL